METLGKVIFGLFGFVFTFVLEGITISTLWGWFIVTQFHLPALSIPSAIGIGAVVSYMTHQNIKEFPDDDTAFTKMTKSFGRSILMAVVYLAVGWVIFQFVGK